jgi:hypothetical protein
MRYWTICPCRWPLQLACAPPSLRSSNLVVHEPTFSRSPPGAGSLKGTLSGAYRCRRQTRGVPCPVSSSTSTMANAAPATM